MKEDQVIALSGELHAILKTYYFYVIYIEYYILLYYIVFKKYYKYL